MTYNEFCTAVIALLATQPAFTGVRIGTGYVLRSATGALLAMAEGEEGDTDLAFEFDSSDWEDGAFEGMTPALIEQALTAPEFRQLQPV